MIIFNLKSLMLQQTAKTGNKITLQDLSKATEIKYSTLSRIASTPNYNINVEHIEKLCIFFKCTPSELISIVQSEETNK